MKPLLIGIFVTILVLTSSCELIRPEDDTASKYNNNIVEIQKQADSILLNTLKDLHFSDTDALYDDFEKNRNKTKLLLEQSWGTSHFNDCELYKTALENLLNDYYSFYENEIFVLIEIFTKKRSELNLEDKELILLLYDQIKERYMHAKTVFLTAQDNFAQKNNLKLLD